MTYFFLLFCQNPSIVLMLHDYTYVYNDLRLKKNYYMKLEFPIEFSIICFSLLFNCG